MATSRDGRGSPSKQVTQHPAPRLKLSDLLRRRKMSLKQMLDEHGLTAYETLVIRCKRMGVQPPSLAEFKAVVPEPVNSAQEGVVVLEAPKVIDEISGRPIDPEATVEQPGIVVLTDRPFTPIAVVTHPWETITEEKLEALVHPQKKLRPKKGDQPPEQG